MTYKGRVVKGTLVLDEPLQLPDGAVVRVDILPEEVVEPLHPDIVRFTGILPENINARQEYVEGMRNKHQ